MNIWITNAYDSGNLGDNFLLHAVLQRAAIPESLQPSLTIVSNHPDGLADLGIKSILPPHWKSPQSPLAIRAVRGGLNLAGMGQIPSEARPDVVLVMAGGYTALKSIVDPLFFANDHFLTLDAARRYGIPAIMFPVSIGPIHAVARGRLLRAYEAYHTIFLRDDESVQELSSLSNTFRVPDFAVQAIAEQERSGSRGHSIPGYCLIARGLGFGHERYIRSLRTLNADLNHDFATTWRLQVPRDAQFYSRARLPFSRDKLDYQVLSSEASVTVSVRLHGALMSILNGVPAVHLSYDRKGAGAYGDLGLGEWLHQADTFDPGVVAEQARSLARDPQRFWDAVEKSRRGLMEMMSAQSDRLTDFWRSVGDGASRGRHMHPRFRLGSKSEASSERV